MMKLSVPSALCFLFPAVIFAEPLAGTKALTWEGDIASRLIGAADRFLLDEIDQTIAAGRGGEANRDELARIVGLVDPRVAFDEPELLGVVAESEGLVVKQIRWPAFGDVHGEGLLVELKEGRRTGGAIVIPDADETPEGLIGLTGDAPSFGGRTALELAAEGRQVVVPMLINRAVEFHTLSNREFIYRPAFVLGRHVIGYELQKMMALADWMQRAGGEGVLVQGHGEGGLLAFLAGAVDERIATTVVTGYSGQGADLWQEPAYRNVFGILRGFDRAGLSKMIEPRELEILPIRGPQLVVEAGKSRGKPGRLLPLPEGTEAYRDEGGACAAPCANSPAVARRRGTTCAAAARARPPQPAAAGREPIRAGKLYGGSEDRIA